MEVINHTPGIAPIGQGSAIWETGVWGSKLQADFEQFDAIVFADFPEQNTNKNVFNTANSNKAVWSPAAKGNVLIVGTDPGHGEHSQWNFIRKGLLYATDDPGKTGLFVILGEVNFETAGGAAGPLNFLSQFGTFTAVVEESDAIVLLDSPTLLGTQSSLQGWAVSAHSGFHTWPATYLVSAVVLNPAKPAPGYLIGGVPAAPYILRKASGTPPPPPPPVPTTVSVHAATNADELDEALPAQTAFFRFIRAGDDISGELAVLFEIPQSGPNRAALGSDYSLAIEMQVPLTILFPAGESVLDLEIAVLPDRRAENTEEVLLNLLPATDGSYGIEPSMGTATIPIWDDPPPPPPANPTYTLTPILNVGGTSGSWAFAINEGNAVAGQYSQTTYYGTTYTGYYWIGGSYLSLVYGSGYTTYPYGINDAGVVVGGINSGSSAFPWAFKWQYPPGTFTLLPGLGGSQTIAYAINSAGYAAGQSMQPNGYFRAVVWSGTAIINLGTLAGGPDPFTTKHSPAYAINYDGKIVGKSGIAGSTAYHAFAISEPLESALDADFNDLGTATGSGSSAAYGVNDYGEVVGETLTASGQVRAFRHGAGVVKDFGFEDLGVLPGGNRSVAAAINNQGSIVGSSYTSGTATSARAVIWYNNGVMKNLSTTAVVPNLGSWSLRTAEDINDTGRIVGYGVLGGQWRAYLLTPNF